MSYVHCAVPHALTFYVSLHVKSLNSFKKLSQDLVLFALKHSCQGKFVLWCLNTYYCRTLAFSMGGKRRQWLYLSVHCQQRCHQDWGEKYTDNPTDSKPRWEFVRFCWKSWFMGSMCVKIVKYSTSTHSLVI